MKTDKVKQAISDFLSVPEQWGLSLSGTGAVYRLERKFSDLVGQPYSLAVSNATSGLWSVFMALGIKDADVITTPYTWGGTLAGLIITGNRPVFLDIDRDTLTIDPDKVAKSITPKTKAILAVDIYGYTCNGQALRDIADEYGLLLIQDCAQSFGAYIGDHHTGWWADVSVFSLTVGKALMAGEGGVIVTKHQDIYEKLVWRTQHPNRQLRDVPHLPINEMAINLRIHPLAAVWADTGFEYALNRVTDHRQICLHILDLLSKEGMIRFKLPSGVKPSFNSLTFEPLCKKERIEQFLQQNEFSYTLCCPPIVKTIYSHEAYKQLSQSHGWLKPERCHVAERQCRRRLRLQQPYSDM